jgi:subtilisin-like proprotein convertase family protein
MKAILIFRNSLICFFLAVLLTAHGQTTTNFSFNNLNLAIPDNDPNGVQDSHTLSGISGVITNIQVSLVISGTDVGAFNGDLYAELVNGAGGFAVLLNRVGVSSTNIFGYGDNGLDVTFSDSAANDIHFYQTLSYNLNGNGQLTGTWQPDGENINPLSDPSSFDDALQNQTALLDSFDGQNPNDTWTLFLADLSEGGTAQLDSWSLNVTTVPEPAETCLFVCGLLLLVARQHRRKKN